MQWPRRLPSVVCMSDSHENGSAAESAGRKRREFSAVGVVFAIVGVVFLLTMDNFAIGIPFIVLGAVFFGMGFTRTQKPPQKD